MTTDEKNCLAYEDVLNMSAPSMPDDEEYMKCYRFWQSVSEPGDDSYDWD